MQYRIEEVTKVNRQAILALKVKDAQKDYIETTAQCLQDALECECYQPVGLYENKVLVGFAMYGFFADEGKKGRVWLDRFFIDQAFQGKGLGKRMLGFLISRIKEAFACDEIFLSLYESNKPALSLYNQFGFVFNGERDSNGEKVMVLTCLLSRRLLQM